MANHLVIMAGGIGSRFWPLSNQDCPKQFIDIMQCGRTMIQQTLDRFQGIIDIKNVWVVTNEKYSHYVQEQLKGINAQHILLEPCMRNTAPCIAYASWKIKKEDPDAVIIVSPSDHFVGDISSFRKAVNKGLSFVTPSKRILTLGIKPSKPETGYGYIQQGQEEEEGIYGLCAFKEKPDYETALRYISIGGYSWNSGIFMWSVDTITQEIRQYAPEIASKMSEIDESLFTEKEQEIVNKIFPQCPKISIDYAVMEHTALAYVMPVEFGWSDLGTWGSLYNLSQHDNQGNTLKQGHTLCIETENCVIQFQEDKKAIIQGLKDYIVAEKGNDILICQKAKEQEITHWLEVINKDENSTN